MKLLPLPKLFPDRPWQSSGLSAKPEYCQNNCPLGKNKLSGFVLDYYGRDPKLAFMQPYPQNSDLISRIPWSGAYGFKWLKELVEPYGLTKDNLVLTHVLRCGQRDYPTAQVRQKAEKACRYWDSFQGYQGLPKPGGILTFDPNIFIITYNFTDFHKVGAYIRQAKADVEKAVRFIERGFRPMLLAGMKVANLVAPWLTSGGVKNWRGHWYESTYNIELPEVVESRRSFMKDKLERKKKK